MRVHPWDWTQLHWCLSLEETWDYGLVSVSFNLPSSYQYLNLCAFGVKRKNKWLNQFILIFWIQRENIGKSLIHQVMEGRKKSVFGYLEYPCILGTFLAHFESDCVHKSLGTLFCIQELQLRSTTILHDHEFPN